MIRKISGMVAFAVATAFASGGALAQGAGPNWTGVYVGGHLGGGWSSVGARDLLPAGDLDVPPPDDILASAFFSPGGSFNSDQAGILIGGQIGAQIQRDRFVFGAELSATGADLTSHFASPFFPLTDSVKLQLNEIVTATGRLGITHGQWLFYVKGGYAGAYATVGLSANFAPPVSYRQQNWLSGYTVGLGGEYALMKNISVGLEYAYIDLGSRTGEGINSNGQLERFRLDADVHTVSARVNFKFLGN